LKRRHLPDERDALTHRFQIADQTGYVTVGVFEDGSPGEVFIRVSKEGSALKGSLDAWAASMSIGLQYGVPLHCYLDKFVGWAFQPHGVTQTEEIPIAQSVVDYVARWLRLKFGGKDE